MESGGVSALSIDCEDMFKEITKKLYGEEAGVEFGTEERDLDVDEQATAWGLAALMQHGVPPPGILQANFTPARPPPGADDRWHAPDEPLAWAHSRVAAYNAAQRLFKCVECDCVGFLARVAEHWLGAHAAARCFHCPVAACGFAAGWARALRQHLQREHHTDAAAADALTRDNPALDDLTRHLARLRARVETKEPPPPPPPDPKRYVCNVCPYATDRRDLFTRHENIHRDEKPFHCYLCHKQFNRADHVKKHFLRMHRDHPYDLQRIRRPTSAAPPVSTPAPIPAPVSVQMQIPAAAAVAPQGQSGYFPKTEVRRGGASGGRRRGERRYSCCYCAWSGVDNWCLKRHLNTHLKPFACALCEYKAARAERLATHVHKVHNKKACSKCPHLADDQLQLAQHLRDAHGTESRVVRVPGGAGRGARGGPRGSRGGARRGPARLFGYMEASDGDGDGDGDETDEFDSAHYYPRDKENLPDLRY